MANSVSVSQLLDVSDKKVMKRVLNGGNGFGVWVVVILCFFAVLTGGL